MATVNQNHLRDYYTNAIGASIHYETLPFKGFSLGLNGIFVYGTFGNDLLAIDSNTGQFSRYEIQLFDIEHKGNYTDLDRLEELYIKYESEHFRAMYGKVEIETPLVNKHDGRMKPKVFSGFTSSYFLKSNKYTLAWFNKASPRSTTHWYKIEDAIGLYESGYLSDSVKAHYHDNITSRGLGIFGIQTDTTAKFKLNIWNYYLDNISNTVLSKLDINNDTGFYAGAMYLFQDAIGNGGSEINEHKYHISEHQTHVLSGRCGWHLGAYDVHLSATHVLHTGMFLFPREFGVDPTYTFLPRSQIEGQQGASSFGLMVKRKIKEVEVKLDWNHMSTKEETEYNKYRQPSYNQFNVDCSYAFSNNLSGLNLRLLYVFRSAQDEGLSLEQKFNQVNFHQINLVANFDFSARLVTSKNQHSH